MTLRLFVVLAVFVCEVTTTVTVPFECMAMHAIFIIRTNDLF